MNTLSIQAAAKRERFPGVERYLYWGVATVSVALLQGHGLVTEHTAFLMFSIVLIGYGVNEIASLARTNVVHLASPVVVASVILFLLPFGLTNLLFLLPADEVPLLSAVGVSDRHLVWAQLLALLGLAGMWIGYRSPVGAVLGSSLRGAGIIERALRRSFEPSIPFLLACMGLSVFSRVVLIRLGIFGYSGEAEQFAASAGFAQWVRLGASMGTIALIVLALSYYGTRRRHLGLLLTLWLVHEVAWGVLAAFKSSVVFPIVVVALCRFVVDRRIPRAYVLLAVAVIVPAYAIVEPMRYLRFADPHYNTRSVSAIADVAVGVARGTDERALRYEQRVSLPLVVASRLHLTSFAARALEYSERGPLPADAPSFLNNLLLAPFYAVAPRALLPTKPTARTGVWFSTAVLGWSDRTSIGMSAVAYLFLAGGAIAVLLGFVVLGVLQRLSFDWLFRSGGGILLVYLVALAVTANVDPSEFWAAFTGYVRYVPLAIVAQAFAFRR